MKKMYSLLLALALAACGESTVMPTITPTLRIPDPTMQSVLATVVYENSQRISTGSPDGKYLNREEIEGKCGFSPSDYNTQTYFTQVEQGDPNSGVQVYIAFEIDGKTVDYLLTYRLGDKTAKIQNRDGKTVCEVDLHE